MFDTKYFFPEFNQTLWMHTTFASLGNYGLQTCTSYSKYSTPEVKAFIHSPKPCAKYSMRERVEENYDVEYSLGSIKIVFNELITVSYDQYSFYGWISSRKLGDTLASSWDSRCFNWQTWWKCSSKGIGLNPSNPSSMVSKDQRTERVCLSLHKNKLFFFAHCIFQIWSKSNFAIYSN